MKRLFRATVLSAIVICTVVACTPQDPSRNRAMERRIEAILKNMSLEEKIGQMTQLTLDVVGRGPNLYQSTMPFALDTAMLDTVFNIYKVGSILNAPDNTPLRREQWQEIIVGLQQASIAATGIPILYGADQMHGVTYTIDGTLFPQAVGMGATFNPELVRSEAKITAYETRAGSIPWVFAPVLDLGRDPRWPRQWETYGEDSFLASVLGTAYVAGLQGDNRDSIGPYAAAACLKHYMGYGVPYSGKDRTPASISPQDMRERHFAPFRAAIRAGALSVMASSGIVNGVPMHANREYLTGWLKEGLKWDGVLVSDWGDIENLYTRDRVACSEKEAIKIAVNAGIDMAMVPYDLSFCTQLRELVEQGEVPLSRIDDAVRRVLRMKMRLGLFEHPWGNPDAFPEFGDASYAAVARRAAVESVTLLKNDDSLLPLRKNCRILVAGPAANSMRALNGGWTLSWQGEKTPLYTQKYNTIVEALREEFGARNVVCEPGITYRESDPPSSEIPYWEENPPQIAQCVAAARNVDYVILCLGENSYCETPGNLTSLDISAGQRELALDLAATGKPVILVLVEGRPRVIADIEPKMTAVLQSYLPGNYGGDALAAILGGDENPSGRLPYTYPKAVNSLITYDYKPSENREKIAGAYDYDARSEVQWPFGYGLSYTGWAYDDFTIDKTEFGPDDMLAFSVKVRNTGDRAGKESVMLFSTDTYASLTPDVRRLRAFDKIEVAAGGVGTVTFRIPARNLAFVDSDGRRRLEAGEFVFACGNRTVTAHCTASATWND